MSIRPAETETLLQRRPQERRFFDIPATQSLVVQLQRRRRVVVLGVVAASFD